MRNRNFSLLAFTVWFLATFVISPNFTAHAQGPHVLRTPDERNVFIFGKDKPTRIGVSDLADGESKTFTVHNSTILVTRKGESLTVLVDGKEVKDLDGMPGEAGKRVFIMTDHEGAHPIDGLTDGQVMIFREKDGNGVVSNTKLIITNQGKNLTVFQNDAKTEYNVADFAEGESRTIVSGKATITATRKGEAFVLAKDGKEFPAEPVMIRMRGDHFKVAAPGDAKEGDHKFVFVEKIEKTDGPMKVKTFESSVNVMLDDSQELMINNQGQVQKHSLKDMNDGETRTFTSGNDTIVVTKKDGHFQVLVNKQGSAN